jgi:hypothetical protein
MAVALTHIIAHLSADDDLLQPLIAPVRILICPSFPAASGLQDDHAAFRREQ